MFPFLNEVSILLTLPCLKKCQNCHTLWTHGTSKSCCCVTWKTTAWLFIIQKFFVGFEFLHVLTVKPLHLSVSSLNTRIFCIPLSYAYLGCSTTSFLSASSTFGFDSKTSVENVSKVQSFCDSIYTLVSICLTLFYWANFKETFYIVWLFYLLLCFRT